MQAMPKYCEFCKFATEKLQSLDEGHFAYLWAPEEHFPPDPYNLPRKVYRTRVPIFPQ